MACAHFGAAKGHPEWHGPFGDSELKVLNSLVGQSVPFVPQEGRKVFWYSCGPTVYDSAHLGHARAYVTFDIIRRILTDYFRYDVFYCMNITDIDDKIILRARRNHLLEQYRQTHTDLLEEVVADVEAGFESELKSQGAKVQDLAARVQQAGGAGGKQDQELATTLEGERLKLGQLEKEQTAFQALLKQLTENQPVAKSEAVKALLAENAPGLSVLAVRLDAAQLQLLQENKADEYPHEIFKAHTERYEAEFMQDMERLGVRGPDSLTRVTEYVDNIRDFVRSILANGFAYETMDGSVYFDVEAFKKSHDYAKLSPQSAGNLDLLAEGEGALSGSSAAGAAVLAGKKNAVDFALWKASKPGEPSWPGVAEGKARGRPGWHIECSAMATHVLGNRFDIHSGGEDLKFPHHDNELAQSEAFSNEQQWVNHFWHAGHLNIEGLKMSKSLKNFITIKEVLEKHSARRIRLLFLLQSWHSQMNFSDESLVEAASKEASFANFFQNVDVMIRHAPDLRRNPHPWTAVDQQYRDRLHQLQAEFRAALADNFDYATATGKLSALVSDTNKYLSNAKEASCTQVVLVRRAADWVDEMLRMFGVSSFRFNLDQNAVADGEEQKLSLTRVLDLFSGFRDSVRAIGQNKQGLNLKQLQTILLQQCDDLRDNTLPGIGVRLEDGKLGEPAVWKLDDPERLLAERQAKLDAQADKLAARLKQKQEQLQGFRQATQEFAACHDKELVDWDPETTPQSPIHDFQGLEYNKSQVKKFKKNSAVARKKHEKLQAALKQALIKDPQAVENLQAEVSELEQQIAALRSQDEAKR